MVALINPLDEGSAQRLRHAGMCWELMMRRTWFGVDGGLVDINMKVNKSRVGIFVLRVSASAAHEGLMNTFIQTSVCRAAINTIIIERAESQ